MRPLRYGRLGNPIEEHLRPDVVRIDTEEFYPEAFLRRFGAAGGFALHAASPDNLPETIDAMAQGGAMFAVAAPMLPAPDLFLAAMRTSVEAVCVGFLGATGLFGLLSCLTPFPQAETKNDRRDPAVIFFKCHPRCRGSDRTESPNTSSLALPSDTQILLWP
jgi:hypothetical protein